MVLVVLVFLSVFVVATLLLMASGTAASERTKQTLARLNAVLAAERQGTQEDELVDVRKKELLSSIPLINRLLVQLEITPKLRASLYQADLKLTPGGLLLLALIGWVFGTYLVYLRTGVFLLSIVLGLIPAAIPFMYVNSRRARRFGPASCPVRRREPPHSPGRVVAPPRR